MKNFFLTAAAAVALGTTAFGASPSFTYADVAAGRFTPKTVAGVRSMADGAHYTTLENGAIVQHAYATGRTVRTLSTPEEMGVEAGRISGYELSANEDKIVFRIDSRPLYRRSAFSRYMIYDIAGRMGQWLSPSDSVRYAVCAPDGDRVAFVLGNDIYVRDMATGAETRVTFDGEANHIINGLPDWVYEEEWGLAEALRWSPDGRKLAFLRFDESRVKEYSLDLYTEAEAGAVTDPLYPRRFTYKYPAAGEENAVVTLHVYDLDRNETVPVEMTASAEGDTAADRALFTEDYYMPYFGWTPDGKLYFYRINRLQNRLRVLMDNLQGAQQIIYEEASDKYIDNIGTAITFLPDGRRFVVKNETRTGFMHLYMYDVQEGLLYPLTAGDWEVRDLVCATDEHIWFLSNETSPLRNNLYVINTDGGGKRRLTEGEGTYRIAPSQGCKYYISYFSNSSTPTEVTLHKGDSGRRIRTLEENAALKAYAAQVNYPVKEFRTFTVERDGRPLELNYYIVKPHDFDPSKHYPVLLTQYSGPASQQVLDRWFVDWEDALVQEGYIVVCMDPRGTGGRGEHFKKLTYGRMGLLETEDQIDFGRYVATLPYVDPARVGIYGWSYGGFMSLNCILKGGDVFRMAISVAPVTSWRYYDSVYTERVNGLPQENAEGYDLPSPLGYADGLQGRLLLMHGSADDNVHPQNSYKMAHELVKAGKPFDMMIYTDDNHSMLPYGRAHVRQKMVDYCLEHL